MGGSGGTQVSTGPVIRRLEYDGGVLTVFWDGPVDPISPPKYVVNVSSGSLDVEKVWAGSETSTSLVLDVTPDQVHRVRIAMYTAGPPTDVLPEGRHRHRHLHGRAGREGPGERCPDTVLESRGHR